MVRRVSKRKMPEREEYQLKELEKIEGGVFSKTTMIYLSKLFNAKIVKKIEFPIARGKEADIYLADSNNSAFGKFVVLKFYRVETSSFKNMVDYIVGDERFSVIKKSKRYIVNTWCKKEYGNLKIAEAAGVLAPKPYMYSGTILSMEFIGDDDGRPAPMMNNALLDNPSEMFWKIIESMKRLYAHRLVHGDMSEYNVLIKDQKPYIIDFGQAVTIKHPKAAEFLYRDVWNITSYFNKHYGMKEDFESVMKLITGEQ
ncbi:MAG: serine protein kinase RIO [Candidatus Micrarchaeia archaeon]